MTSKKRHTLIIDGDVLCYKAALAVETPTHWGDDWWTLHSDLTAGKELVDIFVAELKELTKATDVVIAFSDRTGRYFRKEVYPKYKGHRKGTGRKPVVYWPLKDYCEEVYGVLEIPGLEGDDVIGVLATGQYRGRCTIASIDKDMLTLPGTYLNMDTLKSVETGEDEAFCNFLGQVLTGDKADGYPGCPDIGEVRAKRLLEGLDGSCTRAEAWGRVVEAYVSKGLGEKAALTQARLARILHASDFDNKTKTPILWSIENER